MLNTCENSTWIPHDIQQLAGFGWDFYSLGNKKKNTSHCSVGFEMDVDGLM